MTASQIPSSYAMKRCHQSDSAVLGERSDQIFLAAYIFFSPRLAASRMDPVTVSVSILGIISLSRDITRFIKDVRNFNDPRVDGLYYRMVAQKMRTEAWANRMRIADDDDIRSKIPPENYKKVVLLWRKL